MPVIMVILSFSFSEKKRIFYNTGFKGGLYITFKGGWPRTATPSHPDGGRGGDGGGDKGAAGLGDRLDNCKGACGMHNRCHFKICLPTLV